MTNSRALHWPLTILISDLLKPIGTFKTFIEHSEHQYKFFPLYFETRVGSDNVSYILMYNVNVYKNMKIHIRKSRRKTEQSKCRKNPGDPNTEKNPGDPRQQLYMQIQ